MTGFETEQIITEQSYMLSILRRVHAERALVSVRIGKEHSLYNTIILDVTPDDAVIYLDELNPRSGHEKLHKGSELHLEARLKGIRVLFDTTINTIAETNSIAIYTLPLPAKLIYRQRRRHFRARIGEQEHMLISMPMPLKHHIRGELVDISASGVCSRINYADSTRLEEEQAIHAATIKLPGQNHITCDLEVRSIRHFPEQGYSLIGSEFIDIPPATQNHLDRLVAMLDRHQRRSIHI